MPNMENNIFDSDGYTSLDSAAFHMDNVELIELLIEHCTDISAKIKSGESAWSVAIKQSNYNVVEFLRGKGVVLNENHSG